MALQCSLRSNRPAPGEVVSDSNRLMPVPNLTVRTGAVRGRFAAFSPHLRLVTILAGSQLCLEGHRLQMNVRSEPFVDRDRLDERGADVEIAILQFRGHFGHILLGQLMSEDGLHAAQTGPAPVDRDINRVVDRAMSGEQISLASA